MNPVQLFLWTRLCCCSLPQLNALGVTWYLQLYIDICIHIPQGEDSVCDYFHVFYYSAVWVFTRLLWRLYFHFWRVDAVTQGMYG